MYGIVLYTDGGAIKNPGPAGSGIHGYIYKLEHPKKGTGNSKVTLTQNGYLNNEDFVLLSTGKNGKKKDLQKDIKTVPEQLSEEFYQSAYELLHPYEITPTEYIDGVYSYGQIATNNKAELNATVRALGYVVSLLKSGKNYNPKNLKYVQIISDSEYVVRGTNEYLNKWIANNYTKSDGKEIANKEYWQYLDNILKDLHNLGVSVKLNWIKGHADHLGNELADHLATIGINYSDNECLIRGVDGTKFILSPAQGYWKKDFEKPEFFFNSTILFNPAWGEPDNTFFTCSTTETLKYLGSNQSDASFSLIQIDTEQNDSNPIDSEGVSYYEGVNIINEIIKRQNSLLDNLPIITGISTDVLFGQEFIKDFRFLGVTGLSVTKDHKRELVTAGSPSTRVNITHVINPPYISWRVEDIRDFLFGIIESISNNSPLIAITDITDVFYDTLTKKKKDTTIQYKELKSKYKVGYVKEEVNVLFKTLASTLKLDKDIPETDQAKVVLKLGQDMVDRNTLKRLETIVEKVEVITLANSPYVFQYVVRILTSKGWIISCGFYSNTRCIKSNI